MKIHKESLLPITLTLLFLAGCVSSARDRVCLRRTCFDVEVVRNEWDRMRGLQFRKSLGPREGMLFIHRQEGQHTYWMKNMRLPLDIIWLNMKRHVVHVERNVPPCEDEPCPTYSSPEVAFYVLEVPAGQAKVLGIKRGQTLQFHLQDFSKD